MARHPATLLRRSPPPDLHGKRVKLRGLTAGDFADWSEVRVRNEEWLTPWEPRRLDDSTDPTRNRDAYEARCIARERDLAADQAYRFGLFVNDRVAGEVNLNNVTRGAMQSATIGYWIDRSEAGNSYIAEGVVVLMQYAFEQIRLHRLEICVVPRNQNSRRVMEKLSIREEGIAQRYLEINGEWEDHLRYGLTVEEWIARRDELSSTWLGL